MLFEFNNFSEEIDCYDIIIGDKLISFKFCDITGNLNKIFSAQMRKQLNCRCCSTDSLTYRFIVNYNNIRFIECLLKKINFVEFKNNCADFNLDITFEVK